MLVKVFLRGRAGKLPAATVWTSSDACAFTFRKKIVEVLYCKNGMLVFSVLDDLV